jgi:hypothetical protein
MKESLTQNYPSNFLKTQTATISENFSLKKLEQTLYEQRYGLQN